MIISGVLDLLFGLVRILFGWLSLPQMPAAVSSIVDELFGIFRGSLALLGVFIDLDFVKICIPVLLAIINFEHLYRATMFVIRKLPFGIN